MPEKILVVEDELSLLETLNYNLTRQGYQVTTVSDGNSVLETARKIQPNLIILDIMLPGMDGFEVCRILRKEMSTPIIMLTARDDEVDRIVGLEVGADDYLTKPFSMRELYARVKAMLRRVRLFKEDMLDSSQLSPGKGIMTFGNFELDLHRREIRLNELPVYLKPKEYQLMEFLAQHRGQVLSRDFILEKVWGWDFIGDSRTVDVHIRWLREKFEEDPANPQKILTVRGVGYRFDG